MVTKLGQFTKLGPFSTFQLFKLFKLSYNFLSSFENEFFFDIPSNPPPIAVRNSLTNQFCPTNLRLCIFSTKKCKTEILRRVPRKLFTFSLLKKIYRNLNFWGKIDQSMSSGRQWAGDSQGYQKKIIFIFETLQKMVSKFGQFKKLKC